MTEKAKTCPLSIDLDQFELRIALKNRLNLTLHFDSPSRRFYLSVIGLVVHEMKKQGRVTSIILESQRDLLALLNETIGGSAGSSKGENLLSRVYKKWHYALPNLEQAPLFTVVGRKRKHEEGFGRAYPFTEAEQDMWANLFEYKGSHEHVRLKFAIDKLGLGLDDVELVYKDCVDGEAWDRFIASLQAKRSLAEKVIGQAGVAVPPVPEKNLPLPDKPSIAVLPFVNLSKEPNQEFFSDGMTEDIITALSKLQSLFVIARNSTFTYKGKAVKAQQVAEELGVRYILEGSVQKSGDRVRITAQLIDALKGYHLWSERYDKELKDLLIIQDEITMNILAAIQVRLTAGEDARLRAKGTANLEAYLALMQGRYYLQTYNKENLALARRFTEQALALDPHYAAAYATLCRIHTNEAALGVYKNPREAFEQAAKLGERAITLDGTDALAHATLSLTYVWLRGHDKAIAEAERSVSVDPNSAYGYHALGSALDFAGRPQEAIPFLKKSLRLSPTPIDTVTLVRLGMAYRHIGQYEEAVASYKKALELYGPDHFFAHLQMAVAYGMMGREKEAHAEAAEVLRIDPTFSLESFAKRAPYKDQKLIDANMAALREAGLK